MSKEAALALATGIPAPTLTEAPKLVEAPANSDQPGEISPNTPPPDDLVSSRIAKIAKKEVELRKQHEDFVKQKTEYEQKLAEFTPFYERYKEFEEKRKTDPIEAIKMLQFSDEDFINYVSTQEDKSTPEERATKAAQSEINKFKEEQAKKETEAKQKQSKAVIDRFKTDISTTVKKDLEKFEYCNFHGSAANELIYNTVQEYLDLHGEVLPITEVAELVENFYEEQDKAMSSLKKRKSTAELVAKYSEPVKEEPLRAQVNPQPSKTLTNRVSSTSAATTTKRETPSEKRERLINKLKAGG